MENEINLNENILKYLKFEIFCNYVLGMSFT